MNTLNAASPYEVLFVDDIPNFLEVLKRYVSGIGITATFFASSRSEAERILETEKITRVVSDWKMDFDGVEFLLGIKRKRPDMGCALLTAFEGNLDENQKHALSGAGIEVVEKTSLLSGEASDLGRILGVDLTSLQGQFNFTGDDLYITEEAKNPEDLTDRIKQLELQLDEERELVMQFAQQLLEDLGAVEDKGPDSIWGTGGSGVGVAYFIDCIKKQNEEGRRLLRLDRALQRRLLGMNKKI